MIATERLMIRPYESEDADIFFNQLQADREYLADYFFSMVKSGSSFDLLKKYIAKKDKGWKADKGYACGIFLQSSLQLIGHVSVRNIDWRVPKGEMAYFIFQSFTGHNYASEALIAFRNWCFTQKKFNRLFMKIEPSNIASIKVAEKSGFKWEGLLKKDYSKREQTLVDMNIYGYTEDNSSLSL